MNGLSALHRDPAAVAAVLDDLRRLRPGRPLAFMHVCGTHEHAVARSGLRQLLPDWLRLIAGPGCPVCVCPPELIAQAIRLSLETDAIVTSFGDMLRVPINPREPGAARSLEEARARGGDVRVVLSVADAVTLAREEPERRVVFFAVGFETTACTTAAALLDSPPPNFLVLAAHRLIPPALQLLARCEEPRLDGFLLPGHVIAITGIADYERGGLERPAVVAGFEPLDILLGLRELARQCLSGGRRVINLYHRAAPDAGNPRALAMIQQAFQVEGAAWRGLGRIPRSGLALAPGLAAHDAAHGFAELWPSGNTGHADVNDDPPGCRCGEVMTGRIDPLACPLFATDCTPETPRGACMVGSEGTCRTRHLFREA